MPNELWHKHTSSGAVLKALILNAARQRWNGSSFVDIATTPTASWDTGLIALTELLTSNATPTKLYVAHFPAAITTPGEYVVQYFEESEGEIQPGDLDVGVQIIPWRGASEVTLLSVKLGSDGLDSIPTTAPTGAATTFREMIVQTWRRFFARTTLTATELKTFAADGTTVVTTQPVSDDGSTQVQGAAT